ncbi:LLM class flavin-dependent oxidoreductase [Mycobacterium sp. CBMA271]|uniref:LLM class flavin-dependent oxidoreductase n=1 Tax=unclassified Mycobacteroides TaxID=2618759 RepID=UPI0012DFAECC|nr:MULTISPECIES: LLM class flavin-dependent oxidoreductase [unclassified Mycobacteroides]MUM17839.1 F420-dependent methylene-tetrahydromethanopterin reductase [Mycobacteroides sp. CBMA 326]MUM20410.1 LLM class flavin-dependent oxidoreductase [Mycobacteroides sp. CBMA 271]
MRIGVLIEPRLPGAVDFARRAEELGVASLWVPEVWGYDALTGLAYLAARTEAIGLGTFVVQLGSRSPALLATSALSLQQLSGGRFILGVGTSGPQVMEGWHGVRFAKPVQTTRETIDIVRMVARGERLEYSGQVYTLPLSGSPGKPIRPLVAPRSLPIYNAAMGPANLALTGELADGWLGNTFIPELSEVFLGPIRDGAVAAGRELADIDLVAPVALEFADTATDAAAAVRRHAAGYAFTIGAMGASGRNFYNEAFTRLGYGDGVRRVESLWHTGDRDAAREAVPDDLGRLTNLVGTDEMIGERLERYRAAGISTLLVKLDTPFDEQMRALERLFALL